MKKTLIIAMAALLCGSTAFAQEESPSKFKLYGFVRNYAVVDSREVSGGTHDLYYYMPKDVALGADGTDLNSGFNWKFVSLTSRLGLDYSGYKFNGTSISGKVEADFYSLNGTGTASTIAQFRLRLAYMALERQLEGGDKLSVTIGQAWHPMGADLPNCINLESGAPFGPFNRSPQLMANWTKGSVTLTAGVLYLSQYLPMDAEAGAKSVAPYKYGFPEQYAGITFKKGAVTAKLGATNILTKPVRTTPMSYKANGLMDAVSVFGYLQYSKDLLQVKAKAAYAQSGEHMNILSGYGIASYNGYTNTYEYTPMQDLVSFLSFQYGKKVQVMGMVGYMKQLGTTKDLVGEVAILNKTVANQGNLWLNTAGATNIQQAVRVTPTLVWNLGKFQMGLEYDYTYAQFGNSGVSRNARGLYSDGDTHWLGNHRILWMTKFNF